MVIIKLFLRAGGAAVVERMKGKSEKGNSRGSGSGLGFWVKNKRKMGEWLAGGGWRGV